MRVKNNILVLLLFASILIVDANPVRPKIRRICKSNLDNSIYFTPTSDTCSNFISYYIWGKDAPGNSYQLIDSIASKLATTYTHSGANPNGNPKKWWYFITYTDSCSYPNFVYSDTLQVDETLPDSLVFDSISVDIATNKVVLGWTSNKSPDFLRYLIFRDSVGNLIEVSPGNLVDTFFTDPSTSANPSAGPIKYDITTMDSCGLTQLFGYNPHSTSFLSGSIDTCIKQININWTSYIGWPQIRSHYIYTNTNSNGYDLLDSVNGSIFNYTFSIQLGNQYDIFVRSFKLDDRIISSSSNAITLSSRNRIDPAKTYLSNISAVDPDANQLEISFLTETNEEYKEINLLQSDALVYPVFSINQNLLVSNNSSSTLLSVPDRSIFNYFKGDGINLCGTATDHSNEGTNMVVQSSVSTGTTSLTWNPFIAYDNGVSIYRIYRGTNLFGNTITYELIDSVLGSTTSYTDLIPIPFIGNRGVCYYVEAVQNSSPPHGIRYTSKSFSDCQIGTPTVYIPNAFNPYGFNKTFRPEGDFIDYELSTMEIYDRWGSKVISMQNIEKGWDGKSSSGIALESGVYLYRMKIVSTNGQEKIKQGTVTILH